MTTPAETERKVRQLDNDVAADAIEADDRSAATSPPTRPAARHPDASKTRGIRSSCIGILLNWRILLPFRTCGAGLKSPP